MDELLRARAGLGIEQTIESADSAEPANYTFRCEPLRDIEIDKSQQWLIADFMPAEGLHILFGDAGAGKSFVALHAALHVAAGRSWAGKNVYQAGVVYVASEGGRGFRKRVVAAKQELKLPDTTPFVLITRAPRLGGPKNETDALIADIRAQCARARVSPKLIVLDTLSRSIIDLRESDSQDIMRFVEHAQELGDAFKALVMPVHHCGKDASRGMRGSSALHAAADAEWLVRLDPETGVRRIQVEKMKDGSGDGQLSFSLKTIILGNDTQEEPITTCVAQVSTLTQDEVSEVKGSSNLEPIQATKTLLGLRMLLSLQGRMPPVRDGIPAGVTAVSAGDLKAALASAHLLPSDKKTADVAFKRSLETLARRRLVARVDDFIWLVDGMPLGALEIPIPSEVSLD